MDHIVSLIVFMAAFMIFIGLFSQTVQTSITYEGHRALSTKTSDILDIILLNPGLPDNWGKNDSAPACLGFQDPEFTQYKLSPFSLMRLTSSVESPVYYSGTGKYYNNITAGFGSSLLAPLSSGVNYSAASKLLGLSGVYGFQLTVSPTLTISIINETSLKNPLSLLVSVAGTGYPLAYAPISYSLLIVNQTSTNYPSYTTISGTNTTGPDGSAKLSFSGVNGDSQAYALIVYAHLDGLKGIGYFVHEPASFAKSVVSLVGSFGNRTILLAQSDSVGAPPQMPSYLPINYTAAFVILSDDYTLRQIQLSQPSAMGTVTYGSAPASITVPDNYGILIITYKGTSAGQYGIVLMPWGLNALAFPLVFGGTPVGQEWVTTDIRQVTIGGIAYQAKLSLWGINS